MKHPLLARLRRLPPSRHAAFAAGLRRGAVATRVTPAQRAMRRLRAWTRQVLRSVQVRTEAAAPPRAVVMHVDVHPATRVLLQTHHASTLSATHHRATLLLQHTVARLHSATRTVAHVERTLREAPARPPQRVPMTLTRSPSAAPRADAAPPHRDAESPAVERARTPPPASTARPAASAFALPAQELSRVTEHVIRQLDQRVLSYRERTGRI